MNRQIHIGDKVAYNGPKPVLEKLLPSGSVEDVIPDGMPLGNGERNTSGQDVIICRPDGLKASMLMFLRDELKLI